MKGVTTPKLTFEFSVWTEVQSTFIQMFKSLSLVYEKFYVSKEQLQRACYSKPTVSHCNIKFDVYLYHTLVNLFSIDLLKVSICKIVRREAHIQTTMTTTDIRRILIKS